MEINITWHILLVLPAYLLGAIPTSIWLGRYLYGIDVREHGSGNAGATNTFRVLGKKAGIPVLIFDVLKGYGAVMLLSKLSGFEPLTEQYVNMELALGIAAVLGHIFPVYENFNGGKGIATLLGVVLALHLQSALVCIGAFLVVFLITRYVSLGAIVAAAVFPVMVIVWFQNQVPTLNYFSLIFAIMVLLTHQKNIERLLNNEENKMQLRLKARSDNQES